MVSRLHLRKRSYYIRVALPKDIRELVQRKELCYSLRTNDYYQALQRLRTASAKADIFINRARRLNMEIKDNTVHLTPEEINQMLTYQMRKIDDFCDKNELVLRESTELVNFLKSSKFPLNLNFWENVLSFPEVINGKMKSAQLLFKEGAMVKERAQKLFYEFLEWLSKRPNTKISTKELIGRIKNDGCSFLVSDTNPLEYNHTLFELLQSLLAIDQYADNRFKQIRGEITEVPKTAMIRNLEQTMLSQKYKDTNNAFKTQTKWEDVFQDMVRPTKYTKAVSSDTIKQKKSCLETIFQLMDKDIVEQITYDDCKTINKLIYRVPKKWKERFPDKRLLDVLLPESEDKVHPKAMSARNITKYLTIFQEFLRYCRKSRLIDEDMADLIDKPYVDKKENTYQPFTQEELLLIFNPKTYFKQTQDQDDPKFWIPLMSLFSGARLNELAQIRLDDIKVEQDVYYIQTAGKESHPQQSLKNPQSKRRIPIHPKLKELGFLNLVQHQRKKGAEFLFSSLKFQNKNGFGGAVSNAFGYYLDNTVKITGKGKVFHSFRHTVRPKLRDECKLTREYIDALCGWEDGSGNAGTQNYAHRENIPIKKLYAAISKLQYPFLELYFLEMQQHKKQRAPNRKSNKTP